MFFPATDVKRARKSSSASSGTRNQDRASSRFPSLTKVLLNHQSANKENSETKLQTISKSEHLIHNFKPKKQRLSKAGHQRIMM